MAAELEVAMQFLRKILQTCLALLDNYLLAKPYYNAIVSCTFSSKILHPFRERIKYLEQCTLQVGRNYGVI